MHLHLLPHKIFHISVLDWDLSRLGKTPKTTWDEDGSECGLGSQECQRNWVKSLQGKVSPSQSSYYHLTWILWINLLIYWVTVTSTSCTCCAPDMRWSAREFEYKTKLAVLKQGELSHVSCILKSCWRLNKYIRIHLSIYLFIYLLYLSIRLPPFVVTELT